jgi:hypothetical protein
MNILEKIKITRVQLFNDEQDCKMCKNNIQAEKCVFAQQVLSDIIEWAEEESLSVEEMMWNEKFPDEKFDADNFYDWAAENSKEAFRLCLEQLIKLSGG